MPTRSSSKTPWPSWLAWLALTSALGASGCDEKKSASATGELAQPAARAASAVAVEPAAQGLRTCEECQTAACEDLAQGCARFQGEQAAQCNEVSACVRKTGCGQGAKSLTSCYCGSLSTEKCMSAPESGAGAPDGECAATIRAASGATSHLEVLTGYVKLQQPGGAAMAQLSCQKANCKRECKFVP